MKISELDQFAQSVAAEVCKRLAKCGGGENPRRLLTVPEAATYLGRTECAVRHMIESGKVPVVRDGRRVLLDRRALDQWVEDHRETERR